MNKLSISTVLLAAAIFTLNCASVASDNQESLVNEAVKREPMGDPKTANSKKSRIRGAEENSERPPNEISGIGLEKSVDRKIDGKAKGETGPFSDVDEKKNKGIDRIKGITRRYRETSGVSMSVDKEVYISMMDTRKKSSGKAQLSKGNFRLELFKPELSLLVLNQDVLWLENKFLDDIQVSKISMQGKGRKKGLIGIFFDKESIWDGYRLIAAKTKDSQITYTLKPLKENRQPEATKVVLVIDKDKQSVVALTYWDDIENETSYKFSDVKFGVKYNKGSFEYKPPKGVEITTY